MKKLPTGGGDTGGDRDASRQGTESEAWEMSAGSWVVVRCMASGAEKGDARVRCFRCFVSQFLLKY